MIPELFGLWTVSFWLLLLLSSCVLFAFVEFEKVWGATIALGVTVGAIFFFNNTNPIPYIKDHPWEMAMGAGLYALIGTAWSIYRWYVYLLQLRKEIETKKFAFLKANHVKGDEVPPELKEKWMFALYARTNSWRRGENGESYLKDAFLKKHNARGMNENLDIPTHLQSEWQKEIKRLSTELQNEMRARPRDHKARITLWMMYWPWSLAWYMINDPIRRFFHWIYRRIQGILEQISQHVWKDVEKDLPPTDGF